MATDTAVDFRTRDFVDDGAGAWLETEDSRTAVLFQLECREGLWFGDPAAGSRLGELMEGDEPVDGAELRAEALRALQALVDDGILSDLSIAVDADEFGRVALVINYRDRTTGTPVDISYSPWGGTPR